MERRLARVETEIDDVKSHVGEIATRVRDLEEANKLIALEVHDGFGAIKTQLGAHLSNEQQSREDALQRNLVEVQQSAKTRAGIIIALLGILGAMATAFCQWAMASGGK